jgi:hypothetical protein
VTMHCHVSQNDVGLDLMVLLRFWHSLIGPILCVRKPVLMKHSHWHSHTNWSLLHINTQLEVYHRFGQNKSSMEDGGHNRGRPSIDKENGVASSHRC